MIADKIKLLREASHLTQTELAKKLNITRSSVNAWEMGISVPSTTYLIELSLLFHVSTDFLLGLEQNNTIDISTLSEREAVLVYELVDYFTSQKNDAVDRQHLFGLAILLSYCSYGSNSARYPFFLSASSISFNTSSLSALIL